MTGVFWGLLGAVMIGVSDCIARVTAQRVSYSILFLAVFGLSVLALTGWQVFSGSWPAWNLYGWTVAAASGLLNLLALFFLYRAMARGPVAVASPAASTFSVLLVGMNALSGEPWTGMQVLAAIIVFLGVVMISRRSDTGADAEFDAPWLRVTALYGLAAGSTVSLRMFFAQEAAATIGPMETLYLTRLFALVVVLAFLAYELIRLVPLRWPRGRVIGLVLFQAFLESAALGAFLVGSLGDGRVGAAIGFSAFSAVAALTAWVWLGDRIGTRRMIWMGVVSGGIVLAVLGGPS